MVMVRVVSSPIELWVGLMHRLQGFELQALSIGLKSSGVRLQLRGGLLGLLAQDCPILVASSLGGSRHDVGDRRLGPKI